MSYLDSKLLRSLNKFSSSVIIWTCTSLFFRVLTYVHLPYRKTDLLNDLREYQRQLKDTKLQLEKTESAELEAKATAHDARHALEQAEANLKEKATSSKTVIGSLQLEIKNLKTRYIRVHVAHHMWVGLSVNEYKPLCRNSMLEGGKKQIKPWVFLTLSYTCTFVCRCLATKHFTRELSAMGWVRVIIGHVG